MMLPLLAGLRLGRPLRRPKHENPMRRSRPA
jgi:hypothetical protein